MTRCIDCQHCDLKTHSRHTNVGLAACKVGESGQFRYFTNRHECSKFVDAPIDVKLKREAWYQARPK